MTTKTLTKPPQPKKTTSICVAPDLWQRFRLRVLQERRTAVSVMEQLLETYLARPSKKGGR